MLSCWVEFSGWDEICFRLASVAASNWVVFWRWLEACSTLILGASWTAGSAVPPFLTTFFSGAAVELLAALFRWRRFLPGALVADSGFFAVASGFAFCGSSVASGPGVADGADWGSAPGG